MAITIGELLSLLEERELLPRSEIETLRFELGAGQMAADAQAAAKRLVKEGRLTKHQAASIYQGKAQGLFFGEYVVSDKIGQGGMGIVLKARHRKMMRTVALKVLPAKATNDQEKVRRFYREVEAVGRLDHPNIVVAFDAGTSEGMHYMAMEFVEGADLATIAASAASLTWQQAVDYVRQAASGLAYAHAQGIVHRDIKPSNLLLSPSGVVKVLDLGLARLNPEGVGADDSGGALSQLTRSGQIMGTVDYISPEQAEDTRKADARADIYSLGCTLFHLLTGGPPYGGDTVMKRLLAHRHAPIPSLANVRPDAPANLDTIFRRMVAKKAEDRYPTMAAVIADLDACLGILPTGPAAADVPARTRSASPGSGSTVELAETIDHRPATIAGSDPALAPAAPRVPMGPPPKSDTRVALTPSPTPGVAEPATASTAAPFPQMVLGLGAGGILLLLVAVLLVTRPWESSPEVIPAPPSEPLAQGPPVPAPPTDPPPSDPPPAEPPPADPALMPPQGAGNTENLFAGVLGGKASEANPPISPPPTEVSPEPPVIVPSVPDALPPARAALAKLALPPRPPEHAALDWVESLSWASLPPAPLTYLGSQRLVMDWEQPLPTLYRNSKLGALGALGFHPDGRLLISFLGEGMSILVCDPNTLKPLTEAFPVLRTSASRPSIENGRLEYLGRGVDCDGEGNLFFEGGSPNSIVRVAAGPGGSWKKPAQLVVPSSHSAGFTADHKDGLLYVSPSTTLNVLESSTLTPKWRGLSFAMKPEVTWTRGRTLIAPVHGIQVVVARFWQRPMEQARSGEVQLSPLFLIHGPLSAAVVLEIERDDTPLRASPDGKHIYTISQDRRKLRRYRLAEGPLQAVVRQVEAVVGSEALAAKFEPLPAVASPTPPSKQPPTLPPPVSAALRFEGPRDSVQIDAQPALTQPAFTVEAWVTPTGAGRVLASGHIYRTNVPGAGAVSFKYERMPEGFRWVATGHSASNALIHAKSATPCVLGRRAHVAFTLNGPELTLFVSGKREGRAHVTGQSSWSVLPATLGGYLYGSGSMVGDLHSVRITRGVRYTADFTPAADLATEDATLALYQFNASGPVVRDASGHGRDGRIAGAKWIKADGRLESAEPPDDASAAAGVGTPAPPTAAGASPRCDFAAETDPERRAALWTLAGQGSVIIEQPGKARQRVAYGEPLPAGPLTVRQIITGNSTWWSCPEAYSAGELAILEPLRGIEVLNISHTAIPAGDLKHLANLRTLTVLYLSKTRLTNEDLALLKNLKNLTLLNVGENSLTDEGLRHVAGLTELDSLHLRDLRVEGAGLQQLSALKKLRTLRLMGSTVDDRAVDMLGRLSTLQQLNVIGTKLTPAGVARLRALLPTCAVQIHLQADEIRETDPERRAATWAVARGLKVDLETASGKSRKYAAGMALPTEAFVVRTFDGNGTTFAKDELAFLATLRGIELINLANCRFDEGDLRHLSGLKTLKHLNLWNTYLSDADVSHLKGLTSLTFLNLGNNVVTDAVFLHLTEMQAMEEMYLQRMQVRGNGLESLQMPKLRHLSLANSSLNDHSAVALRKLTSLRVLDVGETQLTKTGLDQLRQSLPEGKVDLPAGRAVASATVTLTFANEGSASVHVFWLDDQNTERKYLTLAPGAVKQQATSRGHTWIVRHADTSQELVRHTASADARIAVP